MSLELMLDLQIASEATSLPTQTEFELWIKTAINNRLPTAELTIRLVDVEESHQLNLTYRKQDKPTNVLSFPFDAPEEIELPFIGDLVICVPVVENEAIEQHKDRLAHWAHIVVHGCLHLLGYDHIDDADAEEMESLEIQLIESLGYLNPYLEQ